MAVDFFKQFVNDIGEPDTTVASEGQSSAEFTGFIDSGSYTLNAALSGSLFGGLPNNKALVLAGDPSTGKTFFALSIVKYFLASNPRARAFYFDTESAVTNEMLTARGIDTSRVAKSEPDTIERFRTIALKVLDEYGKIPAADRFPLIIVLDSLSALPSGKEVGDITEGKDTKDMTKPGLIKGAFRVLRLKMAKYQVPMIITSHTYSVIGAYVPTKEMAGGSGAKYAADTIVFLSKKKVTDDTNAVVGNVVHVRMVKSRLSREGVKTDTRIMFDGGLDRYFGLLEYAEDAGVVKRIGNKYEFPDGRKAFEKAILKAPETFFTPDVLKAMEPHITSHFTYTGGFDTPEVDDAGE